MDIREELQKKIDTIESRGLKNLKPLIIPLGIPEIDRVLPSCGFQSGTVNEVVGDKIGIAAFGFSATLLYLFSNNADLKKPKVLWCTQNTNLYAPGIASFGLQENQLLLFRANKDKDIFLAMEEGLRSGALAAVLGELENLNTTMVRRLQLAAEVGNTVALILRKKKETSHSLIFSRWKISNFLSQLDELGVGYLREFYWEVELIRCQNGASGNWSVKWRNGKDKADSKKETYSFCLVPKFQYRSSHKKFRSKKKLSNKAN